jgi:polyhydroxyalkanoate synthesis repressor PhaR
MAEAETAATTGKILEVRKYPNRRYYDVTRSKHITLEDIRSLIHEGYDVRIIDSKTSADITAKVLTQIILELDEEKIEALPVNLLTRLIRANDTLIKEFIDRYFNQALSAFLEYRKQFEEQLSAAPHMVPFYNPMAPWGREMFNPFAMPFASPPNSEKAPSLSQSKASVEQPELREQVQALQQQLASLYEKLDRAQPKARSRKARRKRSSA